MSPPSRRWDEAVAVSNDRANGQDQPRPRRNKGKPTHSPQQSLLMACAQEFQNGRTCPFEKQGPGGTAGQSAAPVSVASSVSTTCAEAIPMRSVVGWMDGLKRTFWHQGRGQEGRGGQWRGVGPGHGPALVTGRGCVSLSGRRSHGWVRETPSKQPSSQPSSSATDRPSRHVSPFGVFPPAKTRAAARR